MKTVHRALLIALTAITVQGAAAPTPVAAYDKKEFLPPEGQATVVFVQSRKVDEKMVYTVFGADKQCVAKAGGRQAVVVPMKPGPYSFYVTSFKTSRIDLNLEAGRAYFVLLHTVEKFGARVSDITLVRRATQSYLELKAWLKGVWIVHARDDDCHGKPLMERSNRTQRRINEANSDWKSGDDAKRAWYTLDRHEGLTAQDVDWL